MWVIHEHDAVKHKQKRYKQRSYLFWENYFLYWEIHRQEKTNSIRSLLLSKQRHERMFLCKFIWLRNISKGRYRIRLYILLLGRDFVKLIVLSLCWELDGWCARKFLAFQENWLSISSILVRLRSNLRCSTKRERVSSQNGSYACERCESGIQSPGPLTESMQMRVIPSEESFAWEIGWRKVRDFVSNKTN